MGPKARKPEKMFRYTVCAQWATFIGMNEESSWNAIYSVLLLSSSAIYIRSLVHCLTLLQQLYCCWFSQLWRLQIALDHASSSLPHQALPDNIKTSIILITRFNSLFTWWDGSALVWLEMSKEHWLVTRQKASTSIPQWCATKLSGILLIPIQSTPNMKNIFSSATLS